MVSVAYKSDERHSRSEYETLAMTSCFVLTISIEKCSTSVTWLTDIIFYIEFYCL